jgi:hypothetical protein
MANSQYSQITPLNSNQERPYEFIASTSTATPVAVPALTNWTSACSVYQITSSTGFITGSFTSTAATNTGDLGVLPVGFIFSGHRATVKSVSGTFSDISVTANAATGHISIDSVGAGVGNGDIIYFEFSYSIVG